MSRSTPLREDPPWLRSVLASISPTERERLDGRLDQDDGANALAEAAVYWAVSVAGLPVEIEPPIGSLTPDLRVPDCDPPLIMEVWSRNRSDDSASHDRRWQAVRRAVRTIPLPWVLTSHGSIHRDGASPDSQEAKTIAKTLSTFLSRSTTQIGASVTVVGFAFEVIGRAPSAHVVLNNPASMGGMVTSDHVIDGISRKVRKYRRTVEYEEAAFVVAVAGEPGGGLDRFAVESALAGRNSVSVSINPFAGGQVLDWKSEMRDEETPPRFDRCLSAVGFVDLHGPAPRLLLHRHTRAALPLPEVMVRTTTVEMCKPFGPAR